VLSNTLGERSEHLSNTAVINEAEAQAYVDACFAQRERKFTTVEACSIGNPSIRVGSHVSLAGVGPRFENTYYVNSVNHRYDLVHGYQTEFRAECAFFGV
jgi:phage protein D